MGRPIPVAALGVVVQVEAQLQIHTGPFREREPVHLISRLGYKGFVSVPESLRNYPCEIFQHG